MKLLIVEGEKIIRNGIVRHIHWESLGVDSVRASGSVDSALLEAEAFRPDVVITDIHMPGNTDGVGLCRELRRRNENIQLIMIAGYSRMDYLKAALDLGVVSYVEKPLQMEELTEAIRKAVRAVKQSGSGKEGEEQLEPPRMSGAQPRRQEESEEDSHIISTIRRYIGENYMRPQLSGPEIAGAVFLTPSYISGLFRKSTGMTIGQYIAMVRTDHAKLLLRDPRYRFYQIAELCGYSEENYFARAFRKQTGLTPSEFRAGKSVCAAEEGKEAGQVKEEPADNASQRPYHGYFI